MVIAGPQNLLTWRKGSCVVVVEVGGSVASQGERASEFRCHFRQYGSQASFVRE